jgi:hypothetical protein
VTGLGKVGDLKVYHSVSSAIFSFVISSAWLADELNSWLACPSDVLSGDQWDAMQPL